MVGSGQICVSLGRSTFEECLIFSGQYPFLEIRMDLLELSEDEFFALFSKATKSIASCRTSYLSRQQRIDNYQIAIESGADYIDLDIVEDNDIINEIRESIQNRKVSFITSYHDHSQVISSERLEKIISDCREVKSDLIKVVGLIDADQDVLRLTELYRKYEDVISFSMGSNGRYSRLIAPLLRAPFTYAIPTSEKATAPGQYTYSEMIQFYKYLGLYKETP